ncbi:TM116 protein, partial [Polypterus senegalus]
MIMLSGELLLAAWGIIGSISVISVSLVKKKYFDDQVAYCKVNLWCRRYEEDGLFCLRGDGFNNRNIKDIYLTVKFIFLAFLICWTPAFILIILSLANISPTKLFALYIIQAFTMSLQGFLDSIAYGWLRRNFRQVALGERSPILLASNARPFYDESLTLPRS